MPVPPLARVYAYQVIVLDELARHGVSVRFTDAPPLDDDPQAKLLTQVQGVIAEYERAKIAERYRRGKLFRSRAGEVLAWRVSYGYRRQPRDAHGPARLAVFEPEAAVVRRIFPDVAIGGHSLREIIRRLAADGIPPPTGRGQLWRPSTLSNLLRNEAYIGRIYANRTEAVPDPRPGKRSRQVPRPREDWIAIAVPAIIDEQIFEAAGRVSRDNSQWSPRRAEPGQWLLRGLVKCGICQVGVNCHKRRGRDGAWNRYYHCRNHDPIKAGGDDRRCPERNIRSDALGDFVFDQVRAALLRPDVLTSGEQALAVRTPTPDDELLAAELARLDRKLDTTDAERRRLIDAYQAGLLELPDLHRCAANIQQRRRDLEQRRDAPTAQHQQLTHTNQLRQRVRHFASRVLDVIDTLDFDHKQTLLRLVVEEVHVTGWHVQIRLRIPLDDNPDGPPHPPNPNPAPDRPGPASTEDRLRSLGNQGVALPKARLAARPGLSHVTYLSAGNTRTPPRTNQLRSGNRCSRAPSSCSTPRTSSRTSPPSNRTCWPKRHGGRSSSVRASSASARGTTPGRSAPMSVPSSGIARTSTSPRPGKATCRNRCPRAAPSSPGRRSHALGSSSASRTWTTRASTVASTSATAAGRSTTSTSTGARPVAPHPGRRRTGAVGSQPC